MSRRDFRFSSTLHHDSGRRHGQAHWYRASRRDSILRFTIPATIALAAAGVAIGAGIAYFSDSSSTGLSQAKPTLRPRSSVAESSPATVATQRHAGVPTPKSTTATPTVAAEAHRLNDDGYALIQRQSYAEAIPPLQKAVTDLSGTGPADPYEAYANYNLGYALLKSRRCAEALGPLETANRLEVNPAVDRALREARACTPQGS